MQIIALFVHGGIHELQNTLIHIQLRVYFPVLFISPPVQVSAQTAVYINSSLPNRPAASGMLCSAAQWFTCDV